MADDEESTCLGQNIQLSIDALLGSMAAVLNEVKSVEKSSAVLAETMTEIKDIIKHYHNSHLHAYPHDGQDKYDTPIGRSFMPSPITPTEKLAHEFNTNYDIDGNGLIYGTDFKLTGSNIPRLLIPLNNTLEDNKYKKLTMEQYILSVPNHEKIWNR